MANKDKPISQLSQADSIDGTEMIPFSKNGANGKIASALLKGKDGKDANFTTEIIDSTTELDGGVPYFGIPIVEQTDAVAEIEPNVLNRWGEVASLTLNFKEGKPNCVAEYMVEFVSGATATTLSLPSDVKFPYDVEIEPNMRYQLSVINNVGLITGVEL